MGIALHILSWLACLQIAQMFPMQGDADRGFDDYRIRLAKKHALNPFRESLFSSLGFYEHPREGSQRKKAVDSTFIRFGRSSSMTDGSSMMDNSPSSSSSSMGPSYYSDKTSPDSQDETRQISDQQANSPQEVINGLSNLNGLYLKPEDCRVSSRHDLVRVLLSNRNCLLQKAKRENVNDTFIRFGKRSIPSNLVVEPGEKDEDGGSSTSKGFAR